MPPIGLSADNSASKDTAGVRGSRSTSAPKSALGKHKVDDAPEPQRDKVVWSDASEEEREFMRRKPPAKRQTTGKGKEARSGSSNTRKRKRPERESLAAGIKILGEHAEDDEHEHEHVPLPEYLRERKRELQREHAKLHEAGLLLPPLYGDIEFSDDDSPDLLLERRPQFPKDVKLSRPDEEIALECSGGVIPASIAQYLRDYQVDGAKFLHEAFVYQKGAILGDDMGLGKTVQVAAFLAAAFGKTGDIRDKKRLRKVRRLGRWYPRVIIVCPGSLLENWKQELTRWGWWNIEIYHGAGKKEILQTAKSGRLEVMLTTYTTYKNYKEKVNTVKWDAVVADECHTVKERHSEITKAMNEINALCRIGLTGTAIQNKYEELWTLLNWISPGKFSTFGEWKTSICKPLTKGQSHNATLLELSIARKTAKKLVENLLPEFFLRRMKTLIAHQLPKKSDKVVFCPLTKIQSEAYKNFIKCEMVEMVKNSSDKCHCGSGKTRGHCHFEQLPDGRKWPALIFPCMLTLQKLANHLMLLVPPAGDSDAHKNQMDALQECMPSEWERLHRNRDLIQHMMNPGFCGKWVVLKKLLEHWDQSGDKVLVFSHSVRLLHILRMLFQNTSYSVSYLDGSLKYEERQEVVDQFNSDPSQFVFLISTRAGGTGLNITSANKVVIFDPHWNPAHDLQAQDRAYRIGQVRDVDVFRLVSAGTVEEIVYARQIYKQQQANIGYNASTERRYFEGVQHDDARKGEIFGVKNIFTYMPDRVMLRDIVNRTNVAEAKAGVVLSEINIESAIKENEESGIFIKQEPGTEADDDDGGASQLANFIKRAAKEDETDKKGTLPKKPRHDPVQAILSAAGVAYTHENSEVIGSSKVEAQLSRKAEMAMDDYEGHTVLFESKGQPGEEEEEEGIDEEDDSSDGDGPAASESRTPKTQPHPRYEYNPPEDVMKRQFCSMAKEFGFASAVEFALVVESWTQEQRRSCLETFYKKREAALLKEHLAGEAKNLVKNDEEAGKPTDNGLVKKSPSPVRVKPEVQVDEDDVELMDISVVKEDVPDQKLVKEKGIIVLDDETASEASNDDLVKAEEEGVAGKQEPGSAGKGRSSIFIYDEDDDEDDEL